MLAVKIYVRTRIASFGIARSLQLSAITERFERIRASAAAPKATRALAGDRVLM